MDFCDPVSHLRESTISDLESPSNFQGKEEEKNLNQSKNKEIIHLWSRESFLSQRKKISPEATKLCLNLKGQNRHAENGCTDLPVSIIELLIAKGIIPESLSSIGQF